MRISAAKTSNNSNTCRAANAIAFHKSRNNNRKITSGVTRTKRGSKKGGHSYMACFGEGRMGMRIRMRTLRGYGSRGYGMDVLMADIITR